MKRILVIGMSNDHGGIENYILNLYEHLDKNLIQFDFIVKEPLTGDFYRRISVLGGKVFVVGTFKNNIISVWKKLKHIYRTNKYDRVYVNLSYAPTLIYVLPALTLDMKKLIIHSHASDDIRKIKHYVFRYIFMSLVARRTNLVGVGCSEKACEWMFGSFLKKDDYHIINNAVDYKKFAYDEYERAKIRRELGLENKLVIGHVGRFSVEKNHKFILEIYRRLKKENPQFALLLVGDGDLRDDIVTTINEIGLEDVVITGVVDSPAMYYSAMDLFLLPSIYEGFPIVAVEAQINGLKCFFSENIDSKINLIGENRFLSIENAQKWVDNILEMDFDYDRFVSHEKVVSTGFDLENQIKDISEKLFSD